MNEVCFFHSLVYFKIKLPHATNSPTWSHTNFRAIVCLRSYSMCCFAEVKWNLCYCVTGYLPWHQRSGAATSCVSENIPCGWSQAQRRIRSINVRSLGYLCAFGLIVRGHRDRKSSCYSATTFCVCVRQGKRSDPRLHDCIHYVELNTSLLLHCHRHKQLRSGGKEIAQRRLNSTLIWFILPWLLSEEEADLLRFLNVLAVHWEGRGHAKQLQS